MPEDKRAYKRFVTYLEAHGKLPDGKTFTCEIINITPQGLALKTTHILEIGEKLVLEIILIGFMGGERITFECQVVRTEHIALESSFKIGVKILEGSASDHMILYQFYAKKMREGR